MTSNLLRYLLSVKCKRKNSWLSRERFRRFREGCLGFKYPFLGFQSEFCQRNLLQYSGEEAQSLKTNATLEMVKPKGARMVRAMVRALVFHQCGPGSNPGVEAICGLSSLLVLSFAPRGFSPRTPVYPLLKNQHFQILIRPGIR